MTQKVKTLAIVFFLFTAATSLKAQTKFEFMTISYVTLNQSSSIRISINGKDFLKQKMELSAENTDDFNTNPFLNKVMEYQDKGWEVMSFNMDSQSTSFIAFLRRRKVTK